MSDILFQYHKVNPTTWVYLSSLLTIGLFFKFSRVWSVRNIDLIGLILLAPGLLLVEFGMRNQSALVEQGGYVWLFSISAVFLVRLLLDPMMVRRPLLEPNLSAGGMTFIGIWLLVFLMANVVNSDVTVAERGLIEASIRQADVDAADSEESGGDATDGADPIDSADSEVVVGGLTGRVGEPLTGETDQRATGPGYPLLHLLPIIRVQELFISSAAKGTPREVDDRRFAVLMATARTIAIISNIAIVLGMVVIGYRHFDNIKTGIAAATLYLLLPYAALLTGRVDHVLPAALLIWAVEAYRRPLIAGIFLGLACGAVGYPIFLLPLWIGFYWQRGLLRFLVGFSVALSVLIASLFFTSNSFSANLLQMFGWNSLSAGDMVGFWSSEGVYLVYRIPVVATFLVMCVGMVLWPAQKNLGTLMSCSAAVMIGTQFWNPQGGGLYLAWYLPLILLTIFRPNLEDRVALSVLGSGWFPRPKLSFLRSGQAA